MSEAAAGGSTLLTADVGTPQGGQPEAAPAQPVANGTPDNGTPQLEKSANGDWRVALLPEDIRGEAIFQKYQSPEQLARSHINLEKLLGGEKIPKPKSDEDQEGWDRWYKAAGRPDKPDDYAFERPNSLPDNFYDEEAEKSFKTWAHVNGLTKKQAANLHSNYVKTRLEQHQSWQTGQKQAVEKAQEDLRREWGQQYDANVTAARTAINQFADPDYKKWLDESGQGNNPQMIRAFARIGQKLTGSTRLEGSTSTQPQVDVQSQIKEHQSKYHDALYDKRHPDHEMRVAQYNKLFALAYPNPT